MKEYLPSECRHVPSHWRVEPFDSVIFDKTGGNDKIKQSDYLESGCLPVIDQGKNAIAGYVDDSSSQCKVKLPCLLFGDHTRIIKYVDKPFALGADGVKVLALSSDLDPKFVYYYLSNARLPTDAGYSRHFKFLKRIYVPLPPLPEQKRIAAILDKADAIRRKRKESIKLADTFLRSVFLDMFGDPVTNPKGWPQKSLKQLIELKSGDFLPAKAMDKDGQYSVYGGNGINGVHSKYMFKNPKVIIGRVGAYCGVIHLIKPKSWVTDNALVVSKMDASIKLRYLEWMLRIANLNQYASKSGQPLISGGRLYPVEIVVPDIDQQNIFERIVEGYQQVYLNFESMVDAKERFFGSLLHRAFNGKV